MTSSTARRPARAGAGEQFLDLVAARGASWPAPGRGGTRERFAGLAEIAARDLSLARLVEGHADADAICAEAGRHDVAGGAMAVWASDGAGSRLEAHRVPGGWRLRGLKRFCSGSGLVDRALVTAHADDGLRLFSVDRRDGLRREGGEWVTTALADTDTATVRIEAVVPDRWAIGDPGFYLSRPGFWHGAVGVAACWAGGAEGLAERYRARHRRDDGHSLAHLGAVHAECWAMRAALREAADEIDADPSDRAGEAMCRALAARHVVERACLDVMARLDRVGGPRASAFDAEIAQHRADLALYLQQCHGERDLEALGRALPAEPSPRAGPASAYPRR